MSGRIADTAMARAVLQSSSGMCHNLATCYACPVHFLTLAAETLELICDSVLTWSPQCPPAVHVPCCLAVRNLQLGIGHRMASSCSAEHSALTQLQSWSSLSSAGCMQHAEPAVCFRKYVDQPHAGAALP